MAKIDAKDILKWFPTKLLIRFEEIAFVRYKESHHNGIGNPAWHRLATLCAFELNKKNRRIERKTSQY